jgi:hypothetical protein
VTTRAEASRGTSVFNRAAEGFGDWLYQARRGKHTVRRAEMLARVGSFPGGPQLIEQAQKLGVDILVASEKDVGAQGTYDRLGEKPLIYIANTGNPAAMAIALWHELRHMQQDAANPGVGMMCAGQLKDPRTAVLMSMMQEADAFTAETLMALQQKKAGKPEYFEAMFKGYLPDGAHRDIARFLRRNPYEDSKDDAAYARRLFTHLMLDGLMSYRANYFTRLRLRFMPERGLADFQSQVEQSPQGGTKASPELAKLYGDNFMSVSPRALAAAFWAAQPIDEREAFERIEKTVKNAGSLTEQQFAQSRADILTRVKDLSNKDPDDGFFRVREAEIAARNLREQAISGKPAVRGKNR